MFGLSLVVTLLLSLPAFSQVVTSSNLLPGTWSTGSGAVTTGTVRSFYSPPVELALKRCVGFRPFAPPKIPHLIIHRTLVLPSHCKRDLIQHLTLSTDLYVKYR